MSNVEEYAKSMLEINDSILDLSKKISGEFNWKANQVIESYLSMFDRFCPFIVGDRVKLSRDIVPENGSGWYHCRHFLIKGAKATVKERGYSKDKFNFYVEFDNETRIDDSGVEQPISKKHLFILTEFDLEKIDSTENVVQDQLNNNRTIIDQINEILNRIGVAASQDRETGTITISKK